MLSESFHWESEYMMIALIPYMIKYYIQSFRYVPSLLFFIISLGLIYSYGGISVGNNYTFTLAVIFFFSAWITIGFIDVEDTIQQQLTILHVKKPIRYYMSKFISMWIMTLPFNICIVLYPVIFGLFNRPISGLELIIVFIAHVMASLLGISVTALFDSRLVYNRRTAIIVLATILTFSVAQIVVIKEYPIITYIGWITPPISLMIEGILSLNAKHFYWANFTSLLIAILYSFIYSLLLMSVYIKFIKRKMF